MGSLEQFVPLKILAEDGRLLFQVNADGTALGEVADMSEAARVFAKHVAGYFTIPYSVEPIGHFLGAPADPEAFG